MLTLMIIGAVAGLAAAVLGREIGWLSFGYMEIGVLGAVLGDWLLSRIVPWMAAHAVDAAVIGALLGSGACLWLVRSVMRPKPHPSYFHEFGPGRPSAHRP